MDWVKEVLWCLVVHLGVWGIIEVGVLIWWVFRNSWRRLDKLMFRAAGFYAILVWPIVLGFLIDEYSRSAAIVGSILVGSISILMGASE